ncbi:MAG TPA: lysophospholipid acyltransferase family protein [Synergistales bacterium]|nr:lysophospholipid acyltransferase family protein [Synergistales bacterium]
MSLQAHALEAVRKWIRPGWRADLVSGVLYGSLRVVAPRREVALRNMEIAFPESSPSWRRENLSRVYRHFAASLAEYLVVQNAPSLVDEWFIQSYGLEWLQKQASRGKGAVILMAHFGSWELMAAWLARRGFPIYGIIKDPDDRDLAELIEKYRRNIGGRPISKQFTLKEPVRRLRDGGMVVIAGDQNWGGNGALRIPFFGKECKTPGGPAAFAIMAEVPLIPVAATRLGSFRYRIDIGPPIDEPCVGTREEKMLTMTREASLWTERVIRKAPEQWLWMHRRWRD